MSVPRHALAVALAVTAIGAPASQARPATEPGGNQEFAPTVSRTAADEGFDVGSAAVGAGGAAGLLLLTLGGSAVVWQRRHQHLAH